MQNRLRFLFQIFFRHETEEELFHINTNFPNTSSKGNLLLSIESGLHQVLKNILEEMKKAHPDTGFWMRILHPDLGKNRKEFRFKEVSD